MKKEDSEIENERKIHRFSVFAVRQFNRFSKSKFKWIISGDIILSFITIVEN